MAYIRVMILTLEFSRVYLFLEKSTLVFTSRYHFQRMFHALTGFTLTEYIRNRRLTLAGEELSSKDVKITDIAFKYDYESPDAFAKSFQRLHGATPSKIRKSNVRLKAFPKLSFRISIKGECEMNYRIVKKDEFKVFGVDFLTSTVDNDRKSCYTRYMETYIF